MYHRRLKMSLCCHPGCRVMTTNRFCGQHKYIEPPREKDKFLNSPEWIALRNHKIEETPWCEECDRQGKGFVPGIDVDHIIPRKERPDLSLEKSNLQTLCLKCHCRKTRSGK